MIFQGLSLHLQRQQGITLCCPWRLSFWKILHQLNKVCKSAKTVCLLWCFGYCAYKHYIYVLFFLWSVVISLMIDFQELNFFQRWLWTYKYRVTILRLYYFNCAWFRNSPLFWTEMLAIACNSIEFMVATFQFY